MAKRREMETVRENEGKYARDRETDKKRWGDIVVKLIVKWRDLITNV